jgi:hypothetical protein
VKYDFFLLDSSVRYVGFGSISAQLVELFPSSLPAQLLLFRYFWDIIWNRYLPLCSRIHCNWGIPFEINPFFSFLSFRHFLFMCPGLPQLSQFIPFLDLDLSVEYFSPYFL